MSNPPNDLVLYQADTAVCAAKVRVTLAEKGLAYEGRMLSLHTGDQFKPDYMKLNPAAVVPTLVHKGEVVVESTVINEYLDEAFPEPPLRPADPLGRARMRLWTKREDTIHDAINTITASLVFRVDLLKKTEEQRRARYEGIPDPAKREKWRVMLEQGGESSYFAEALTRFAKQFRDMEKALAASPWLAGDAFTLADAGLLSFFYRLEMAQCAGMWRDHFPRVREWFERARGRESFRIGVLDPIPAAAVETYRANAGPSWPQVDAAWRRTLAR
ncbi:MAG TPA: glutathione S-transferase family protein [Beijerinckiaceae bacterium]|jgi:glutathione S-transferase